MIVGASKTVCERPFIFVLVLLPEVLGPKWQSKLGQQEYMEPKRTAWNTLQHLTTSWSPTREAKEAIWPDQFQTPVKGLYL